MTTFGVHTETQRVPAVELSRWQSVEEINGRATFGVEARSRSVPPLGMG